MVRSLCSLWRIILVLLVLLGVKVITCCNLITYLGVTKLVKASDIQVAGNHYKDFKIQPTEFIHKNNLSYIQGNIIKYTCRYKNKNGIEDLQKIKHYVDLLIELEYDE